MILADRAGVEAPWRYGRRADGRQAVEQLAELRERGVKIRSRALMTTLWARLVLGDLFLHGIGGAKYDQVTDLLMERFFQLPAPGMMVISATLHLPIARPPRGAGLAPAIARQLRELTYHPERFLQAAGGSASPGTAADGRTSHRRRKTGKSALSAAKERWIHTPQTADNARARWQSIRQINEALQPWLSDRRRRLEELQAEAAQALQAEKILAWREYGFCLYPEATLRKFLDGLLPKNF